MEVTRRAGVCKDCELETCLCCKEVGLFPTLDLALAPPSPPELPVPDSPSSPGTIIALMRTAPGAPLQPSRRLFPRPAPSAYMLHRAQETQIAILTAPEPVVEFVSSANFDDSLTNFDGLNTVGKTNGKKKRKALTELFPCIKRERQPICSEFKAHDGTSVLCSECGFLLKDHNKIPPIVSPRASNRCVTASRDKLCYRHTYLCMEHQVKKAPVFKATEDAPKRKPNLKLPKIE